MTPHDANTISGKSVPVKHNKVLVFTEVGDGFPCSLSVLHVAIVTKTHVLGLH